LRFSIGTFIVIVCLPILFLRPVWCQSDWPMFGHDYSSTRHSSLDQINTRNVHDLKRAWTYHLKQGDSHPAGTAVSVGRMRSSEAVPLVVNGVLYMPTPYGTVVALDSGTGQELWTYRLDRGRPSERGVSYWPGDKSLPALIVFGTSDGRLFSLDAVTGKLNLHFGENGVVDVKSGVLNGFPNAQVNLNSPPLIYKDLIISGVTVQESPSLGASGDTRAWDVHTGKLVWRFNSVPHPGELGNNTWDGESWRNRSGTNVWGLMSVDPERGLIFLPYGSPTFDFYGADRKGKDLFGNSLVALDAETGKLAWYYQFVHHDTWDYDLESAPVLMDVIQREKKIPAIAVISKSGLLFILDRRDGAPLFGVEERPVSPSEVPGETSWPTQPFPLKPPPLGRNSFKLEDVATVTPEHQKICTDLLATEGGVSYGGPYTPYGSKLTIVFPGTLGIANWPGMSFDPGLRYLFVNTVDVADIGKIVKTADGSDLSYERTSPWGSYARFWNEEKFWPCQKPPWGQLWAINTQTGDVAWRVPLGTIDELDAKGIHGTGSLNFGGSITTAGGLLFIAATDDQKFRAFDTKFGKELWSVKLETGSYTTPITFQSKNGRQYVLVVATGGSFYDRTTGDSVIAFALPE